MTGRTGGPERLIAGMLAVAIVASIAGFGFEATGAHELAGLLFVVWAVGLVVACGLLAVIAGREREEVATVGFVAVALYGFGTALNSSLLARGMPEASVGLQPGIWAMLVTGLVLVGATRIQPSWVRAAGIVAAFGHTLAAVALLFGAQMPHTGAEASDWAPMVVAVAKLALWITMGGWIVAVRKHDVAHRRNRGADRAAVDHRDESDSPIR